MIMLARHYSERDCETINKLAYWLLLTIETWVSSKYIWKNFVCF